MDGGLLGFVDRFLSDVVGVGVGVLKVCRLVAYQADLMLQNTS